MIIDTDDLSETINTLMLYADPRGRNYSRLKRLKSDVDHRIMIGPSARRFIHGLVAKLDNIECEGLSNSDKCLFGFQSCDYSERFSVCSKYKPVKPFVKGGPEQGGEK